MRILRNTLQKYFSNKKLKQVGLLFSSSIIVIPFGLITSIVLSKLLGADGFGDYKFILSIFALSSLFFNFGFFHASNRAIILSQERSKIREFFGASFFILIILGLIIITVLYCYSYLDSNLEEKGIVNTFRYILPLGFLFLIQEYFETILKADNKIKLLSLSRLLYVLVFMILIVLLYNYYVFNYDKLLVVLIMFSISKVGVFALIIKKMNISFINLKNRLKEIWVYNIKFGINVYFGAVLGVGFAHLLAILISYYGENNQGVGFYTLSLTLSLPLTFIPKVVATSYYRDFPDYSKIPTKLILSTLILSSISLIALWILIDPFINIFYGKEFLTVISLTLIVSIGVLLHSFADFLNLFLNAHGKGQEIRNGAIIVGITLFLSGIILIPIYGEYGAAYSKLISGVIYFLVSLYYYLSIINSYKIKKILCS